jgi:hypothetical protein
VLRLVTRCVHACADLLRTTMPRQQRAATCRLLLARSSPAPCAWPARRRARPQRTCTRLHCGGSHAAEHQGASASLQRSAAALPTRRLCCAPAPRRSAAGILALRSHASTRRRCASLNHRHRPHALTFLHRGRAQRDVTQLIGRTTMVWLTPRLTGVTAAKIAAKLEIMEPCCSVKDRLGALALSAGALWLGPMLWLRAHLAQLRTRRAQRRVTHADGRAARRWARVGGAPRGPHSQRQLQLLRAPAALPARTRPSLALYPPLPTPPRAPKRHHLS